MNSKKVSIIIPAYNEQNTVGVLVARTKELFPEFEIIVVNDGSNDNTSRTAKEAGALVCNHPYNIGNGAAIKSGIRMASGDILVFMDGDAQHNPEDIRRLLENIPEFDMVVGARKIKSQASIGRAFGNKLYNWFASYVAKFKINDLTSGFRAVKADIAKNFLYLIPNTYSYPTTLTLGVLRNGRSIKYIPIQVKKRVVGKSKVSIMRDGVRFFMIITKICTLYSPLRVFLPVSFGMFLMGLGWYVYTFFKFNRFTNMSAFLFITSVLIFMMGLVSEQICQMRIEKSEGDRSM